MVFLLVFGGCAPMQTVVKINGMQMAPETELQNHPATKLSFTYSYYRVFKQKIKARGHEEEIRDTEPLKTTGILKLPKNTEAIGVMIYVDNPEMRQYKIVVTETRKGEEKETVIYQGIRPDNLIRYIFPARDLTDIGFAAKIILQDRNDVMPLKGVTVTKQN
ncbi:MAG: hypothetical protein A3J76_00705 [Candidatus Moranbacteria bacterium RBG_13_45_13]|nr:MAG: hypothetical protein A3J76_00705 [Candidatus Moranbacteria bacterium RBG_13_45_13]